MKISSSTSHFEIKYLENGMQYSTVITTGIVDDTEIIIKYLRKKYKGIELIEISKLDY